MHFRLFAVIPALALLPFACASDDPEPEETREGFCLRWAEAACSDDVVSACQAASATQCRLSQERFCIGLVPAAGFSPARANDCVDGVSAAYADADLDAAELEAVLRLGPPCDRLVRGPREAGETCDERVDCDTAAGYTCVLKGQALQGTCEEPRSVDAGRDCSADNAVCTDGFYCNGSNCIEQKTTGAACVRDGECKDGFCDSLECSAGLAVDSACTDDVQCASGLCYRFSATEQVCTDRVRLSRTDPICDTLR